MKFFEKIIEAIYWILIALSPTLVSLLLAFFCYYGIENSIGKITAILVVLIGVVSGIFLANWVKKKYGTSNFYARLSSSSEKKN